MRTFTLVMWCTHYWYFPLLCLQVAIHASSYIADMLEDKFLLMWPAVYFQYTFDPLALKTEVISVVVYAENV